MVVTPPEVSECFRKTADLVGRYPFELLGSDPPRSVDELRSVCEDLVQRPIWLKQLHVHKDSSTIWASRFTFDDHFDVAYVSGLNYCWRRFVVCKELFHVAFDDQATWNMNVDQHITEMTIAQLNPLHEPGLAVKDEAFAELAAVEFLFPYKDRVETLHSVQAVDFYAVAKKYRVPQVYVERYLSEEMMTQLAPFFPNV